ncbi:TetR family transcriptional regulator [Roseomonas hellenica]|uniref:TetR family transcriptional regulator n=1 Tax=Plastoroseomonas hellenica TaxID=2687306 RepID=A0ABS5F2S6_9PROT|nr:TetR family transcriptional regulator [Plastoroseomonas hellenica]MBR0666435.1 TetR family transcriptional regulator [Plastoroseomonas hellenica]
MARRTRQEAEQTQAVVLGAAIQVFLERGVARATLEEVARAAGVTRGAVYWHFRNKLDLFMAIDRRARLFSDQVLAGVAAYDGPDPLAALTRALVAALALVEADTELRRMLTVLLLRCEYTGDMAPALDRQRRSDESMRAEFIRIFERAAAAGTLAQAWRPEAAALALHALLVGLLHIWLHGSEARLAVEGAETVRSFLASLRAAPLATESAR